MMAFLWCLAGVISSALVCAKVLPGTVRSMVYGDTFELADAMLLTLLVFGIVLICFMLAPISLAFILLAMVVQKYGQSTINRRK